MKVDVYTMYVMMERYQKVTEILVEEKDYAGLCNGAANFLLGLEGTLTPDMKGASPEATGLIKSLQILNEEIAKGCKDEKIILDAHAETMRYMPTMKKRAREIIDGVSDWCCHDD